MTQGSPTTGELVARLRAHGAESWSALMDDAADRLEAATTLERKLEEARVDHVRMDWLVSQHVEVRTPLVYGSRALFVAQTLSDEENAVHRTDLRAQVDAAIQVEESKP